MIDRIGRCTALVIAVMAVGTACGSSVSGVPAANGSGGATTSAPAGSSTAAPSTGAAASTSSPVLKFAGKTVTASLNGYDSKLDMVQFHVVRFASGGVDDGHYVGDPADPAAHRLPLAKASTILSAVSICSTGANEEGVTVDADGHANKACTKDQLAQVLSTPSTLIAELKVDATDHIEKLSEVYAP
jgi:hypothetical protein